MTVSVNERETRNLAVIEVRARDADEFYSAFLKVEVGDAFCVQQNSNTSAKMKITSIMELVNVENLTLFIDNCYFIKLNIAY